MEQQQNENTKPDVKEREQAELWIASHFSADVLPPFSFTYDGKPSSEFLKDWLFSQETKQIDDTRTERVLNYTDPQTGLIWFISYYTYIAKIRFLRCFQ